MEFFLRFTLISYAAIFFFTIGMRMALAYHYDLNLLKLVLIFIAISIPLLIAFTHEPLRNRLIISAIWTSVIVSGVRFGRKVGKYPQSHIDS